jgi:hypothetical protein
MPTPTYTALATVTLGGTASSVTFSSIPATYRDLILVTSAKNASTTDTDNLNIRFNGDTGSNYSYVQMFGIGSDSGGTGSGTETNLRALLFSGSTKTYFANGVAQIMDYSATDKHKTVISRRDSVDDYTVAVAGRWANTAAITSVVLTPVSGSLASGSTFNLFGVIA